MPPKNSAVSLGQRSMKVWHQNKAANQRWAECRKMLGGGTAVCVCVVAGSGGGLWTDVWLSLFIFVNVPKVRVLELAAPFTALQITQNQMNAHR